MCMYLYVFVCIILSSGVIVGSSIGTLGMCWYYYWYNGIIGILLCVLVCVGIFCIGIRVGVLIGTSGMCWYIIGMV